MKYIPFKFSAILFMTLAYIVFAGPEIEVDKDFIQGLKTLGGPCSFTFTVRNSGDKDLVIKSIKTSCGCTWAKALKSNISPNETTQIVGEYKPNPTQQSFNIKIIVMSNAINEPQKKLGIIGQNFPPVIEIQPKLIHASYIIGDPFSSIPVTIMTRAEMIYKNAQILSGKELFSVEVIERSPRKLRLEVIPKKIPNAIGKYQAEIQLKMVLDHKAEEFVIPVTAEIVPELKVYPPPN